MDKDILVFASKDVGHELLSYLLDSRAPVTFVVAAKPEDRKILEVAAGRKIRAEVFSADTIKKLAAAGRRYDWLLNLWSPHILPENVLSLAEHRLNIHSSLVPHCRGNDNTAWAIRKKLPAGASLIEMTSEVDSGGVYVQEEVAHPFPTKGKDLQALVKKTCVRLFQKHWPEIHSGKIQPRSQAGTVTSHTRRQTEQDRLRDSRETMSLEETLRWALAHDFSPGTTAEVRHENKIYKLTVSLEEKREER